MAEWPPQEWDASQGAPFAIPDPDPLAAEQALDAPAPLELVAPLAPEPLPPPPGPAELPPHPDWVPLEWRTGADPDPEDDENMVAEINAAAAERAQEPRVMGDEWPPAHWATEPPGAGAWPPAAFLPTDDLPPGQQPAAPPPITDPAGVEFQAPGAPTPGPQAPQQAPPEPTPDQQAFADVAALEKLDPVTRAGVLAARDVKREDHVNKRREELLAEDLRRRQEAEARYEKVSTRAQGILQRIDRDAQELTAMQIDPDRWWSTRTTGQKVAGALAAIIGGYMSPTTGGVNRGLEQINEAIDRDIQAQIASAKTMQAGLDQQRGLVGELMRAGMDEFQAAETVRLGALKTLDIQLGMEAAKFDPRGTRAKRILQARQETQQSIKEAQVKLKQQTFDNELKRDAEERQQAELRERIRANLAREAMDRKRFAAEQQERERQRQAQQFAGAGVHPDLAGIAAANPQEAQRINDTAIFDPFTGRILRTKNGGFATRGGQEGQTVREMGVATKQATDLMRELISLRHKHGWESDAQRSEAWQAMKSRAAQLMTVLNKNFKLGALDSASMDLMKEMIGGDPTQLRDPVESLKTLYSGVGKQYNDALKGSGGYTGDPVEFAVPGTAESVSRATADWRPVLENPDRSVKVDDRIAALDPYLAAMRAELGTVEGTRRAVEDVRGFLDKNRQALRDVNRDIEAWTDADGDQKLAELFRARRALQEFEGSFDQLGGEGQPTGGFTGAQGWIERQEALLKEQEDKDETRERIREVHRTAPPGKVPTRRILE